MNSHSYSLESITRYGLTCVSDVTDYDSYDSLVNEVDDVVGEKGLNLLINNAGIAGNYSLDETTASLMIDSYKTSTVAPLMMTKVNIVSWLA